MLPYVILPKRVITPIGCLACFSSSNFGLAESLANVAFALGSARRLPRKVLLLSFLDQCDRLGS